MRQLIFIGTIVGLAVLTSGCASTQRSHNYIDADARPHIQELDSVLLADQDELEADINVSKISTYLQGHIAPILFDIGVNTYRTHKANKLMSPIHDNMEDYNITESLHTEMNLAFADSKMDGASNLKVVHDEEPGFRAKYIRESMADAVMFVDTKYQFTPSFEALQLLSSVTIFPVNPELSPYKEKPDEDDIIEMSDNIYRNNFVVLAPLKTIGKTSENGAAWAEFSEEELEYLMQYTARKLADTIADDLLIDDIPEDDDAETTPEDGAQEDISIAPVNPAAEDSAPEDLEVSPPASETVEEAALTTQSKA